jgi:putative peptidoglycan lipid II flippase
MLHWRDMERSRIAQAAIIITLGNLATSVLGFVRAFLMARYFGSTGKTDAFVAAYTVPQMFYDLVIGGAVSAALIPTFTRLSESDRAEFWRVVMSIFGLAAVVLLLLVAVLEVAARPLMILIASGFAHSKHQSTLDLSVQLVRIILPTLFFWGLAAVSLAALYSLGRRVAASFASACFHLGIIIATIVLAAPLGIVALPIGASVGAAAQFLVQVPSLIRAHGPGIAQLRPHLDLHDPVVRKILVLYGPVALGIVISIGGQIADTNFKSHLHQSGDFTAMQYATQIIQFPVGIVVAALGLAVLPMISSDAAAGRIEGFKDKLAIGFRLSLVIMIPATFGVLVLGRQIVTLLFQHGQFTSLDTSHTTTALLGYAPQLMFVGIDQLLIFAFYARHNTITPMLAGVFGVVVYVVAAFIMLQPLQILGLALANTIQIGLHALLLLILLLGAIGTFPGRNLLTTTVKVVVASAVMAAIVLAINQLIPASSFGHLNHLIAVIVPVAVATAAYGALLVLFRVEEVSLLRDVVIARFRSAPAV